MANKIISSIPNTITTCNLLSGCIACIMALKGFELVGPLPGWQWACYFIILAAVFDYFDGAFARMLKAYSEIGRELDSLSDLVSFGVAPSFVMLAVMNHWLGESVFNYAVLIIPALGALRLARFNVCDAGKTTFRGLPIPSNAMIWVGLADWISRPEMHIDCPPRWVMIILLVLVSLLMVSNIPMFSLKFHNFNINENFKRYVLMFAALMFVICYGMAGLAWTIVLYLLISLFTRDHA